MRLSALADLSTIEDSEEVKAQKALAKKKKRKQAEETDDSEEDSSEDESEQPKSWDAHNKKKKFMKMAKEVNAF